MHIVAIILYHIFISLAKQYKKTTLICFYFSYNVSVLSLLIPGRLFRLFIDGLLNVCHGVGLFMFSLLHYQ